MLITKKSEVSQIYVVFSLPMDLEMLKSKRFIWLGTLVAFITVSIQIAETRINASIEDFNLTCGSRSRGPMDITFHNPDSDTIASIYINNKPNECSFHGNGMVFTITDARKNGCAVMDPTSPHLSFYAIVFLQEDRWFQQATDPKFLLSCVYTGGDIKVKTSPLNVLDTTWNVQDYRWKVVHGYVDMSYQLGIFEDDGFYNRPIFQAKFGQKIALKVTMSGTDKDEKGIRVRQCVAKSGGMEAMFIKNYCSSSSILFANTGFISNGTQALLSGLDAFRIAGSEDLTVTFECLLDVCADTCDGFNCRSHQRFKRDTSLVQNVSQIETFTKIRIIDFSQENEATSKNWCINQLEFFLPITCLSCLLCLTFFAMVSLLIRHRRPSKVTTENVKERN